MTAASLAQGGPWDFRYICSGDSDILMSASDVTDLGLLLLVERLNIISSHFVIAFKLKTNSTWHLLCFQVNRATNANLSQLAYDVAASGFTGKTTWWRVFGDICPSWRQPMGLLLKYILLMKHVVHWNCNPSLHHESHLHAGAAQVRPHVVWFSQ